MHLTISKFAFLKTPKYSVTLHNDQGGSCSIGQQGSMKAVGSHIWFTYAQHRVVQPNIRVIVETWHGFDDNDKPVITTDISDVDAILSRIGTTRKAVN